MPVPAVHARSDTVELTGQRHIVAIVCHLIDLEKAMSRIRVLFDLSTVSKMHGLGRLSQLVPIGGNVIAYASTVFLEELSGLRRKHPRMYEEILDWYRSCTFGRFDQAVEATHTR